MGRRASTIESAKTVASLPRGSGAPADDGHIPTIEGYEIEGELGRGGMGVVYQAVQTKLGRPVALKMVLAAHAQGEERERFIREAEAVAQFQHPNIVQIYEVGEAEGRPYFSLEYVDGGNLEDKFGGKPMAWKPAAELLRRHRQTRRTLVRASDERQLVRRCRGPRVKTKWRHPRRASSTAERGHRHSSGRSAGVSAATGLRSATGNSRRSPGRPQSASSHR